MRIRKQKRRQRSRDKRARDLDTSGQTEGGAANREPHAPGGLSLVLWTLTVAWFSMFLPPILLRMDRDWFGEDLRHPASLLYAGAFALTCLLGASVAWTWTVRQWFNYFRPILRARAVFTGEHAPISSGRHGTVVHGVLVGADGMLLRRSWGRVTWVPWSEVWGLTDLSRVPVLVVTRGEGREHFRFPRMTAEEFAAARAAFQRYLGAAPEPVPPKLVALGEALAEDPAALRTVEAAGHAATAHAYRSDALPPAVALRVLEDPRAAPLSRLAAAAVLRASGGDAERARLRVATSNTANPALREALTALDAGELDETHVTRLRSPR